MNRIVKKSKIRDMMKGKSKPCTSKVKKAMKPKASKTKKY